MKFAEKMQIRQLKSHTVSFLIANQPESVREILSRAFGLICYICFLFFRPLPVCILSRSLIRSAFQPLTVFSPAFFPFP